MPPVASVDILTTLLLCGLMGTLGQGVRAVIGLKNTSTALGPNGLPDQQSEFNVAYFSISLMIGFTAGVLAGIGIGLDKLMAIDPTNLKILLGIAVAGYAGTDFIENAFSRIIPGIGASPNVLPQLQLAANLNPPPNVADQPVAGTEIIGLKAALVAVAPKLNAAVWTPPLSTAFKKFDATSHRRMAAALGQFLVESGASFQETIENLNYTHAERIVAIFPKEIPTVEEAQSFVGRPEALANRVYANRNGNGDEASGDGFKFRGRGLIQITGRDQYTQFAAIIGKTIDATVAYCETPEGAAMSGCWYFSSRGCLPLADTWQISQITKDVNGTAMEGAAQRLEYAVAALKALGG